MWQPGKVLFNKISTNNTYLATTNFCALLEMEEEDNKNPRKKSIYLTPKQQSKSKQVNGREE
jgi:hypothetical protein